MKLTERLNVLIQAVSLSQKNGALTLDEAVKAKSAIDIISSGTINQNFTSAINVLIEIAVSSQKKGVYSLKDAYMIYLAVENIENELKNEISRLNMVIKQNESKIQHVEQQNQNNEETVITVPPQIIKIG